MQKKFNRWYFFHKSSKIKIVDGGYGGGGEDKKIKQIMF